MYGKGKFIYSYGDVYIGDFANDKKNGLGKIKKICGEKFVGNWENDEMHGLGLYTW